jgi:hypothetical protein
MKTFEEWHKVNAKYMEPADIVPWCNDAWREGYEAGVGHPCDMDVMCLGCRDCPDKAAPSQEPFIAGWLDGRGRFFYANDPMYRDNHEGMRPVFTTPPDAAAQIAELLTENRTLVRQNGEWQEKCAKLEERITIRTMTNMDLQMIIVEQRRVMQMALDSMSGLFQATVDAMTGVEFMEIEKAITALRECLGEGK